MKKTVAIIGSGVSGLTAARCLCATHDVSVFEASSRIGGHTATVDVNFAGVNYSIDTGFIIFNKVTYLNFTRLLEALGVKSKVTEMGFGIVNERYDLAFSTSTTRGIFAQLHKVASVRYWRFLFEILRFNKIAKGYAESGVFDSEMTVYDFSLKYRFSEYFLQNFLRPLTAIIWSQGTTDALDIPFRFFCTFFYNHGLFSKRDVLKWFVVENNSRAYLEPLIFPFKDRVHTDTPITQVIRKNKGVELLFRDGTSQFYDVVIFATHSNQALELLGDDASSDERDVLSAIPYSTHEVAVHYDETILPQQRAAWDSWNIRLLEKENRPIFTYNMNVLQGMVAPVTFCVTLDGERYIDPQKILYQTTYHHPVYSLEMITAQTQWSSISKGATWFAGAYWRNGFHEDGVWSGIRVAKHLGGDMSLFEDTFTE